MYTVILKKNEDIRIRNGHSWVYANETSRVEGEGGNGALAAVYSYGGDFLGKGFINFLSKILVRIISRSEDENIDRDFYFRRIYAAKKLRESMGYSNNYRAVFAEADGMPAFICDKFGDVLSCQFLSLAMEKAKQDILSCLTEIFSPRSVFERNDVAVREKEGLRQTKGLLYGVNDPEVIITENGLKIKVNVMKGQKTGYFLDQKENRRAAGIYAKGKRVLDCFSNSGGFALNCAARQASSVTAADISDTAVNDIAENASLNSLKIETVKADVFDLLRSYGKERRQFDMIILDPPAFCKSAAEISDASRGYRDINTLAMKLITNNGILATCSCSHYMSSQLFEKILAESARAAHKTIRYLERRFQAPDHPYLPSAEETLYLKFCILSVCPAGSL